MPRRLLPKRRRQRSSREEMAGDHVYAVREASPRRRYPSRSGQREGGPPLEMLKRSWLWRQKISEKEVTREQTYALSEAATPYQKPQSQEKRNEKRSTLDENLI
jgi:hypothetical protein